MEIEVWYYRHPTPDSAEIFLGTKRPKADLSEHDRMGVIEVSEKSFSFNEQLENAFNTLQHIDGVVTPDWFKTARSFSCGDVFVVDGRKHWCATYGFQELTDDE